MQPALQADAVKLTEGFPAGKARRLMKACAMMGLEERRILYEREARAFAAEPLMPFFEVRRRWFAISQEHPFEGELSTEGRVDRLAAEFGVTPAAMRVRLQQMKLIP
jgi:Zn-dependent peptidase ImmA (M78 family)